MESPDAQVIHVGRRIDGAQGAVNLEGGNAHGNFHALRKHHLENVAGADVFLGALHHRLVARTRHVGTHAQRAVRRARARQLEGPAQEAFQLIKVAARRVVL